MKLTLSRKLYGGFGVVLAILAVLVAAACHAAERGVADATGIAQVHGSIERGTVFKPLGTQPVFDARHRIENTLLQIKERASECRSEMRNHSRQIVARCLQAKKSGPKPAYVPPGV